MSRDEAGAPPALPFTDSRRLTGANPWFRGRGAALETAGVAVDAALLEGWREHVARACAVLGWETAQSVARAHPGGASLALAADVDRLYLATEIVEWALCAALAAREPSRREALERALRAAATRVPGDDTRAGDDPASPPAPVLDESAAFARFADLQRRESEPALRALCAAATQHGVPALLDDERLSLGAGRGSREYARATLPAPDDVPWDRLHAVPTALVTASNGKTTIVRLIAACLRAHGLATAHACTDGVWLDDECLEAGDYAGPTGARLALRAPGTEAAVLETARGGLLRRGLALERADVAVVANVSADHYGEYGVHDLGGIADAKLTVVSALTGGPGAPGLLVTNAEDACLVERVAGLGARFGRAPRLAWFALDADHPRLVAHRAAGGATCGVRDGRLVLGADHDLGAVAAMPLALGGTARYNVANLAAAALAAEALGVPPATIARAFAAFGARAGDNPGRSLVRERGGVRVLVDYAHNPVALRGALGVARQLRAPGGRLGVLLGHAGNRHDADLVEVARVVAAFAPDLVVVKELDGMRRGREPGEVPRILREALVAAGVAGEAAPVCMDETEAVERALAWAQPGDAIALLVHSHEGREQALALLGAD